jgi:hypothetical protein
MTVWDALRTADLVTCDILRGEARFQIAFTIDPPAGRVPPDLAPAPAPAPAPTKPPAPAPTPTVPAKLK